MLPEVTQLGRREFEKHAVHAGLAVHVAEGDGPNVGQECIKVPESPDLGVRELK
jgi:hypothetical protein